MDELERAVQRVELAATDLSLLLHKIAEEVRLATGRPLGNMSIGEKIKVAKMIVAAQQKLK